VQPWWKVIPSPLWHCHHQIPIRFHRLTCVDDDDVISAVTESISGEDPFASIA
jgi:hypothetical protein